jgi:predicted DCC family thiol-disulfide oxidoreductase YuxK
LIVLFDGVCNLCNGAVVFIIKRDPQGLFRFATLQSDAPESLLRRIGARRDALPDSMALIERGSVYARSTAALRIARRLRFPWPLLYALIIVPRPLRDWIYDLVARRRYHWFGKRAECMVPTPELRRRFLA